MQIFECLEVILLRTASDLSHFSMVGNAIVKKTVSNYMKRLQGSLHSDNHRCFRWSLCMYFICHLSLYTCLREVLYCPQVCPTVPQPSVCFSISGTWSCQRGPGPHSDQPGSVWFSKEKRQEGVKCPISGSCIWWRLCIFCVCACLHLVVSIFQGKPDVRMAFIQFVLSFFVSGDSATIGQVLEIKGNGNIHITD